MTLWLYAALFLGFLVQEGPISGSFLGKAPPELASEKGNWINSTDKLTFEGLKGKVVWIEFGYLKCSSCLEMKPTLARWHRQFADKGLVVIDIDYGFEDTFDDVKKHAVEKGAKYAILWDKEGKNSSAYDIQGFPIGYLIGVDGKVIWEGVPGRKVQEIEKRIEAELEKVEKK